MEALIGLSFADLVQAIEDGIQRCEVQICTLTVILTC